MKFDPEIIETFARRLYSQASRIVIRYALLYALLGGAFSAPVYYYLPAALATNFGPVIVAAIVVLFALVGASVGNEKAFMIRLQAQMALCYVQIERNTRAVAEHESASAGTPAHSLAATHLLPVASAAEAGFQPPR